MTEREKIRTEKFLGLEDMLTDQEEASRKKRMMTTKLSKTLRSQVVESRERNSQLLSAEKNQDLQRLSEMAEAAQVDDTMHKLMTEANKKACSSFWLE